MSPPSAATATTILDRCGDISSNNGKSFTFGHDGGQDGGRGPKRPMPHISDLTNVSVGVDALTPIGEALQKAESFLKQAEASRNFGRADFALKDFLCATVILDNTVKRNKRWPALAHGDMKQQRAQYDRLVGFIRVNLPLYEKIRADIEADNARTGVQPSASPRIENGQRTLTPVARRAKGASSTQVVESAAEMQVNGSAHASPPLPRARPDVRPKPQALSGKAIKPTGEVVKSAQELAQRFAKLRPNQAEDALGAQGPPKQPRLDTSTALPSLPKVPAAIYSPARGTVSSEAAELPSSTPRGIFSRTNSVAATSTTPRAQSLGGPASARKRASLALPRSNTISAHELVDLMQKGTNDVTILIIDIRSRVDFDEGHIMSHATICIEPDILERENISAAEIGDSMVLNPSSELSAFERRRDFDLVVFYDDRSTEIPAVPQTRQEKAICGFYDALCVYDYVPDVEDKREPRLLRGGLQAWTSLMGNSSLQTSSSSLVSTSTPKQRRQSVLPTSMRTRPQSFVPRPIQNAEEAHRWQMALTEKDAFAPVRSTDDFLRRYPAVSQMQESMTSPGSSQESLYSAVPPPPTRPAPALPRSSHSGLDDPEVKVQALTGRLAGTTVPSGEQSRPGLLNPQNWCYANSMLQVLFSTVGFSEDLSSGAWLNEYKVPKQQGELINHPQIMARCLQSLFFVISTARVRELEATVLMKYIQHLDQKESSGKMKDADSVLGGNAQQDATEFMGFIVDTLHDETNVRRDVESGVDTIYENDARPIMETIKTFWQAWTRANQSLIDRYWRMVLVSQSRCWGPGCTVSSRNFNAALSLPLSIIREAGDSSVRLEDMIQAWGREEAPTEFKCGTCQAVGQRRTSWRFARLPDRLVFHINRTLNGQKDLTTVRFPVRGLSLADIFVEGPYPADERHFNPLGLYDLYAVITHLGGSMNSGHYIAFAKDHKSKDDGDWLKLDDSRVTRLKVKETITDDETSPLYSSAAAGEAFIVFYQRRGT